MNDTSKDSDASKSFMDTMNQAAAVQASIPMKQQRRLRKLSSEAVQELVDRMRSCKSDRKLAKWNAHAYIAVKDSRVKPDYDRLKKLISSMEVAHNYKFQRDAIDDCAYPFADDVPED